MAATRQGIIKKGDVGASGAEPADASILETTFRIPRTQVVLQSSEEPAPFRHGARLGREATVLIGQPVEVGPKPLERVKPPSTAQHRVEPAEPTIEEIERRWSERLELARREARAEGVAEGRAEAGTAYEKELTELRRSFAADLQAVHQSWETFLRRAEPWILQLSFRVAGAILDAPIPDDVRRISERAVANAVESMVDGIPLEVVLHPVSFLRIKESGIYEQLSSNNGKLRWRTNTDLRQNEWIVQSQRAVTRRLESELIDRLQHELSLLDIQRAGESAPAPPNDARSIDATPSSSPDEDASTDHGETAPKE